MPALTDAVTGFALVINIFCVLWQSCGIQCFDTVGWISGREHLACKIE